MSVIRAVLNGIDMGSLRECQAVIFLRERLASGGAAGERYAEFAGESGGQSFDKKRLEEGGVFLIGDVEYFDVSGRAVNGAPSQGPARTANLKHAQAIGREVVWEIALAGIGCGREGDEGGCKGPPVCGEHFSAHGVVVAVAQSCCRASVGIEGRDGGFAQLGQCEVADVQRGENMGWRFV